MKQLRFDSKIKQIAKNIRIAALGIGAAILVFACTNNDLEQIKAFSLTDTLPILEAENFETLFTDSGQIRFFLKTPKLLRYENSGKEFSEFPEGMELRKYDDNKNIVFSITSDYAKEFVKEERWEAKNNVVATNSMGDTLKTDHLIMDEKTEKIYTDEFVKIIRPDQIITGIGFTSDLELKKWRIKDLKGEIYVTMDEDETLPPPENSLPEISPKENVPLKGELKFDE